MTFILCSHSFSWHVFIFFQLPRTLVFLFLHATLITFSFLNLSQRTLIKFLFIRVTLTMLLFFPFFSILSCDTHVSILSILYSVYTLKYPLFCITILFTDDYSAFLFFQQAFIHRCHSFSWHFNPRVETLDGPPFNEVVRLSSPPFRKDEPH